MLTSTRSDPDARLTRIEAAAEANVHPSVISMWRYRGHLRPDRRGLYRRGDVLAVEAQTARSPNNRVPRRHQPIAG